ncbi:MAG: glycine cleavage system protein GcvH [Deltaproteobacteria bacterium]|nr:glycine cleavage system protein GcvH [Deltaproteobacteria bacterium]
MKEIEELILPEDVRYTEDHEWAKPEGETVKAGINDYAQDQLGDIVFVELPRTGESFGRKETFGTIESVKAVAELYMPVAGEILAVNNALEGSPELVNSAPYHEGWIVEIRPGDPSQIQGLMDRGSYIQMLKGKK